MMQRLEMELLWYFVYFWAIRRTCQPHGLWSRGILGFIVVVREVRECCVYYPTSRVWPFLDTGSRERKPISCLEVAIWQTLESGLPSLAFCSFSYKFFSIFYFRILCGDLWFYWLDNVRTLIIDFMREFMFSIM